MFPSWLAELRQKLFGLRLRGQATTRCRARRKRPLARPRVEPLEDRTLPSVSLTNVPQWVSQGPGPIQVDSTIRYGTYAGAVESLAVEGITNNNSTHYI